MKETNRKIGEQCQQLTKTTSLVTLEPQWRSMNLNEPINDIRIRVKLFFEKIRFFLQLKGMRTPAHSHMLLR